MNGFFVAMIVGVLVYMVNFLQLFAFVYIYVTVHVVRVYISVNSGGGGYMHLSERNDHPVGDRHPWVLSFIALAGLVVFWASVSVSAILSSPNIIAANSALLVVVALLDIYDTDADISLTGGFNRDAGAPRYMYYLHVVTPHLVKYALLLAIYYF